MGLRGPKPKYPLKKWFNGKKHLLRFGIDFKANLRSMINYLYKVSKDKKVKLKLTSCIEIQATPVNKVKKND